MVGSIKIIFVFLLIILLYSCQNASTLFPPTRLADGLTGYDGEYISTKNVGQNESEKLHVYVEENKDNGFYMWIGSSSTPSTSNTRFEVDISSISGTMPDYAFNNKEIVGTLTFMNQNRITISFATMYKPYLNIQNVICNKQITTQ